MPQPKSSSSRTEKRLFVVSALAGIAVIVTVGAFHYAADSAKFQRKAEEELIAIADAKAEQILAWRRERLGDGIFFSQAPFVLRDLQTLLADPAAEPARTDALKWLDLLKGGERYEQIVVARADGSEVIAVSTDPSKKTTPPPTEAALAMQGENPILSDLHRDGDGRTHMDVLVPILAPSDPDTDPIAKRKPIAAMILRLDPEQFLFPLINSHSAKSPTGEAVLMRREGNEGVFLTKLRHAPNTGERRFSINDPHMTAARALR